MLHPISCPARFDREGFTNPFRYAPHPLVKKAAGQIMAMLERWRNLPEGNMLRELERSFAEGKMLGVLVVSSKSPDKRLTHILKTSTSDFPNDTSHDFQIDTSQGVQSDTTTGIHFIAAFSGTVRGADGRTTATVDGFVPPIIDLTAPEGYFKLKEAEISHINHRISELSSSSTLRDLKDSYQRMLAQQENEISAMQEQLHLSKTRREEIRKSNPDTETEAELIKESQFQKAQLKRLKDKWKETLAETVTHISAFEAEISALKNERSERSDELQKWIFENALVHNALGEVSSIWEVFNADGLIPPGGTGDCAAPKLLEYAYRHGLQPLAMGEFWYGISPTTAVRTHGHFYPSCTSKCGPLLSYMMQGMPLQDSVPTAPSPIDEHALQTPVIIHEDESIIVVEKPSGMPSVPGLDGRTSLQEWLSENLTSLLAEKHHTPSDESEKSEGQTESQPDALSSSNRSGYHSKRKIYSVHRLDMDTSGVMVYAKTEAAALHLRKQFEEHTIRKTYIARLTCCISSMDNNYTGTINLPLSPDYDERPRQKVDFKQGKPAHTDYKILQTNPDGTTDILLYPLTGRTHQLRVHCAHTLGLARPIAGDLLYGAHTANCFQEMPWECQWQHQCGDISRLCLHALSITFIHPLTGTPQTFTSNRLSF